MVGGSVVMEISEEVASINREVLTEIAHFIRGGKVKVLVRLNKALY
jgi:hypothetical protein